MAISEQEEFEFRARLEREQSGLSPTVSKKRLPLLQQLAIGAQNAMAPQQFSPQSLLNQIPGIASGGAHSLGGVVAEDLARNQVNPYLSAGIGTLISMGPDIAMAGINPMAGSPRTIPNLAVGAQRRALGFRVPELKTIFGRGKAAEAAKVALQQGVISPTGSPKVLFKKASDLAAKSGQKLGQIRESVGPQPIEPILNSIDQYKSVRLKGAAGGKWDAVVNKIDEVKNTIKGLSSKPIQDPVVPTKVPQKVSLKRIADAKKEIADSVNWMADNVSQRDAKGLAMAIEKGTERALANAGGDIKAYKALKPIYSAAKTMIKGLNREVAAQEGNMAISLPALVAGASGGPATALKIGAFEWAKRRGAGIAASELVGAASLPKTAGIPLTAATKALVNKDEKPLTKAKAYEFFKKAMQANPKDSKEKNRKRARRMAKNAGYTWEGDF